MKINVDAISLITDHDDLDIEGTYEVKFDVDTVGLSDNKIASMMLDLFHSVVAISTLEEFEVSVVTDDGLPIDEDPNHAEYSFKGSGLVTRISTILLQPKNSVASFRP